MSNRNTSRPVRDSSDSRLDSSSDPGTLLRAALAERCARNEHYSLRAFARSTGISHTVLSLTLSGKRRLSRKATLRLAEYLGLDPAAREGLLRSFPRARKDAEPRQDLALEAFEVISDWYHFGILSALELPGAKFEARWLAAKLGIPILKAKLAMERLQSLGLVELGADGRWVSSGLPLKVDNRVSTPATRKFHRQLLQKATEAIDGTRAEARDFTAITFVMDPALLSHAKKRIQAFRRQLSAELESMGSPKAVYELSVQLFPLTPITSVTKEKKS